MVWPTRVPPVLAPPTAGALMHGAWSALTGVHAGRMAQQVSTMYPASRVRTYESGRAALATALGIAMRSTGRRRVVLPAFTSYSVAAAAVRAGADVVLADISAETLDYNRAALREAVDDQTSAVVLGNLFGYPSRSDDLSFVAEAGALLIDDAAQAVGATASGVPVGARGAMGVLSFGRGKCVTTGQGGALLMHDAGLHLPELGGYPASGWTVWVLALAVAASQSPLLFGLMARLPGVRVGESHFDADFALAPATRSADGLATGLAAAVARQADQRRRVAASWRRQLAEAGAPQPPDPVPGSEPACLRVPLFTRSAAARERAVRRLAGIGMPYVGSYPEALTTLAALRPFRADERPAAVAEGMAATALALPCHAGVSSDRMKAVAAALAHD